MPRMLEGDFDYIVVGAGTAGCILANRLSADGRHRVVLLEAGPESDRFFVNMPAGGQQVMADADLNWMHRAERDPSVNDREIIWNAGKMLGGGSAINGMVYIRGARADYDNWAAMGCAGCSPLPTHASCVRAGAASGCARCNAPSTFRRRRRGSGCWGWAT